MVKDFNKNKDFYAFTLQYMHTSISLTRMRFAYKKNYVHSLKVVNGIYHDDMFRVSNDLSVASNLRLYKH